ncbi:putative ribonuclease H-like domain-containing protein, partial [Tanacetum coccineum]
FEDPQFPDKVYKVEKALYGLHQAPRAWYETFSTYLIENGFRRGTIDKTLFIKKDKGDILLVQVYVDDIIFGSTKKSLCDEFEEDQDEEADSVDVHLYKSMIRSLMYLTASRPDIMFVVCACARDSPFDLESFSDSDYARASLDRKSTIGAEYVAAGNCCGQIFSQRRLMLAGLTFWLQALVCLILRAWIKGSKYDAKLFNTAGLSSFCRVKLCTAGTNVTAARLADYTSWMLRMECKSCQVMKMG